MALYENSDKVTYFHSFGVEHISKEIEMFIGNKNIITNIHRIQAFDLILCKHFSVADFMLKGKSLFDYKNLFYPNDYEEKKIIILKYFH